MFAMAALMACGSQAFAAEGAAARIGDVEYETLVDAVAEVKMRETITLLRANNEDIKPKTAFFIERAAYSGIVSPYADQCLEKLGTDSYVVNGKAVAYTKKVEGTDNYGEISGTLNQVFEQLYGEGKMAYFRAWMPPGEAGKRNCNGGYGLWRRSVWRYDHDSGLTKGHNWDKEFTVDRKATCTEDGRRSVHCANCEAVKYELKVTAKGHSYGEWETVDSPDCENTGSKKHT